MDKVPYLFRDGFVVDVFTCAFVAMLHALLFGAPAAGILSWLIYKGMVTNEQLEGFAYHLTCPCDRDRGGHNYKL